MGHKDEEECPPAAGDTNLFRAFANALAAAVDAPVTMFRGRCFTVYVLLCKLNSPLFNLFFCCRIRCCSEPKEVPMVPSAVPQSSHHRPVLYRRRRLRFRGECTVQT